MTTLSPSLRVYNITWSITYSRVTSHMIIAKHKQKGWAYIDINIQFNNIEIHPRYFIQLNV